MKQYKCNGCSERCGSTASDRPTHCLFAKDSEVPGWELIEQPVRNNYATIQRYAAPVINWKKAFEMLIAALDDKAAIDCSICPAIIDCGVAVNESCTEAIEKEILKQCTEGGE